MRTNIIALTISALLALPGVATAGTDEDVEYLLGFIAESGCTFIRNSERHDAVEAADHLRMKYETDKRHIKSAEQFIDRLASASSLSGQPYVVSCGGKTKTSRDWLNEALVNYQISPPS